MRKGEQQDYKLTFGKFKGQLLADVPNTYLVWLEEQDFVYQKFPEMAKQIKIEIEYRNKFEVDI